MKTSQLLMDALEVAKHLDRNIQQLESQVEQLKQDKIIKKAQLEQLDIEHRNLRRLINSTKADIKDNDAVIQRLGG